MPSSLGAPYWGPARRRPTSVGPDHLRAGYDFKQLFSISEFYDRDRPAYYAAIQSVRENDSDLTYWLEYFLAGLHAQLRSVQEQSLHLIRLDVVASGEQLSDLARDILQLALSETAVSLQVIAETFPSVSKRTLQREVRTLIEKQLLLATGATRSPIYQINMKRLV